MTHHTEYLGPNRSDPLGDGGICSDRSPRVHAALERGTKIANYTRHLVALGDKASYREAYESIPHDWWADEDFRAAATTYLMQGARAQADLDVISRVFGGSKR